jgi:hypothetical protein
MSTALDEVMHSLFECVNRVLEGQGFWGSKSDIQRRMQSEYREFASPNYSYALSDEYLQSLIAMPNAIKFVSERKPMFAAVWDVCINFISTWQEDLKRDNLLELVQNVVSEILIEAMRELDCQRTLARIDGLSAADGPAIDELLTPVAKHLISVDSKTMFEWTMARWLGTSRGVSESCGAMDFLLRVRECPGSTKLYVDPTVLRYAFDVETWKLHWCAGSHLVESNCDPRYVAILHRYVSD